MNNPGISHSQLKAIALAASRGDKVKLENLLVALLQDAKVKGRVSWEAETTRFLAWLRGERGPYWSIFIKKGNKKLPFCAFSSLPIYGCPGAGSCASYCYSLKAWRNPMPYFRQLGNFLLLQSVDGREFIQSRWMELPNGLTVRLYVDGDFDSVGTAEFWADCLRSRPDIQAYGYSKSLKILASVDMPENYTLNLSNGGRHDDMIEQAKAWPMSRGGFYSVPVPKGLDSLAVTKGKVAMSDHKAAVRQAALALGLGRVFICPGQCGSCTPKGHACGSDRFKGVSIAIGVH